MKKGLIEKIHESLVSRKISCVDLVNKYLSEIEKSDLNAFITVTKESALEEAKKVDERIRSGKDIGMFEGIPMTLKDNFSTKGVRTTCGSKMLENYIPCYDSTVYEILKKNGCILLGKANQDEFAMGSSNETSYFGPVKNPHDKTKVAGGSSGGPCAAISGGLAAFAIGSDTGGSIRQPASFCGIVGMKPTYGSISRYGLIPLASSLDQAGPLTLTVRDCSLVFDLLSEHDPRDETSRIAPQKKSFHSLDDSIEGLKIGIPTNFDGCDHEVHESIENVIKFYEKLGAKVSRFDFPELDFSMPVYCVLGRAETASNMARYTGIRFGHKISDYSDADDLMTKSRSQSLGAEVKRRIMLGSYVLHAGYDDSLYKKSLSLRNLIRDKFAEKFNEYDIILAPTSPTTAFEFNYASDDPVKMQLADICVVNANIAGIPAISVPCGYDSNNLPIGVQLMAKQWDDDLLLRVAYKYEKENFVAKIIGGVQIEI